MFAAAPAGVDAVVHLAGIPGEASLPDALSRHVVTTAALLDAMVAHGVPGSCTPGTTTPSAGPRAPTACSATDVRPRPDTFYGVAKVAAEGLLSLYVDRYGIDAVVHPDRELPRAAGDHRGLATWLSHDDAVRMVDAGADRPDPGFAVLYGISANTRALVGPRAGPRRWATTPQDDAEEFAGQVAAADGGRGRGRARRRPVRHRARSTARRSTSRRERRA